MLSALRQRTARRPRSQDGFSLVELVVAMAAAIVVVIGAFSILIVTLHQTQRTFTKVDATRRARIAMANIENELHSACVAGDSPIQGVTAGGVTESDANNLVFFSFFGTSATPVPVWHQLSFNSAAGTLTDSSYNVTGTAPDWTQGTLISATQLLSNVAQVTSTTPVFQYYAYATEWTDAAGNIYRIIPDGSNATPTGATPTTPLSTSSGLSASDADNVVEVDINLLVGASAQKLNNPGLTAVDDPVNDSISLRLTTPPDYVPAGATASGYGPCE